jgi:hypothetical protein
MTSGPLNKAVMKLEKLSPLNDQKWEIQELFIPIFWNMTTCRLVNWYQYDQQLHVLREVLPLFCHGVNIVSMTC